MPDIENLEIIHIPANKFPDRGSLLLLHGAAHAAWMWQDNFAPWFAQQGYTVYAMSLRNHGNSACVSNANSIRIKDYVADVETVIDQLPAPVYVIGHSMGGFVIQHYLTKHHHTIKKAVLLCSIPPHGLWRVTLKTLHQFPKTFFKANLWRTLSPIFKNPILASRYLFSQKTNMDKVKNMVAKMQDESYRAYLDCLFLNLPNPKKVKTPIMVIGGEADFFFPPEDIKATAKAYQVTPHIIPDAPHNLMLEPGWEYIARLIATNLN